MKSLRRPAFFPAVPAVRPPPVISRVFYTAQEHARALSVARTRNMSVATFSLASGSQIRFLLWRRAAKTGTGERNDGFPAADGYE